MAYASDEYEFLFFAAPATGSTAVISAFEDAGIGRYLPEESIERDGRLVVDRKHCTLADLEEHGLVDDRVRDYLKFVGVRNPFSFYVAKYLRDTRVRLRQLDSKTSFIARLPEKQRERTRRRLTRQAEMSFDEYLRYTLSRKSGPGSAQAHFHDGMDVFVHQEALAEDLASLCARLGIDGLDLDQVNVTGAMPGGKSYRDFYSDELVELVYEANADFFRRFPEYSFAGLNAERSGSVDD
jgi:hypothetical protein